MASDRDENFNSVDIIREIFKSRKNSNLILKIEERLLSEDEDVVLSSIESAQELFLHFLENKEIDNSVESVSSESTAEEKYKVWLKNRFDDFKSHVVSYMRHENQNIQETALEALMKLLKAEGENSHLKEKTGIPYFPKESLAVIVCSLLSPDADMLSVINNFEQYLIYDDVKLHVIKVVLWSLNNDEVKETNIFLQNAFVLLSKIHFPKHFGPPTEEAPSSIFVQSGDKPFILRKKIFSRVFSEVWVRFLKYKLPPAVYKKTLVILPKRVLPHLKEPLVLTDFFTDSYNVGGVVSLLALNGIFYLMEKFNLEYADFFIKLYAMFSQEILTSKFRARFFFLSDLFLSSTHLPAYLVAAFLKRLARLALCVPPDVVLIILPFIGNLLIRHRSLQTLIHCPDREALTDPYDFEEPDPAKSHAIESSLWEVKSLQSHWNPDVSKKAKFINSELRQMEWDFSDQLEVTVMELAEKELCRTYEEIPTAYDKPSGFFKRKEDTMNSMWTL